MNNTVLIDLRADEWVVFEPSGAKIGEYRDLVDAVSTALGNIRRAQIEDGSVSFVYDFAP